MWLRSERLKCFPNRLPWGWGLPMWHKPPQPVLLTLSSKVQLVIPLHFSHCQNSVDVLPEAAQPSELCCELIFMNVLGFESSCSVHGKKPAAEVTEDRNAKSDEGQFAFPSGAGRVAVRFEHLQNAAPMVDFFAKNAANVSGFCVVF